MATTSASAPSTAAPVANGTAAPVPSVAATAPTTEGGETNTGRPNNASLYVGDLGMY